MKRVVLTIALALMVVLSFGQYGGGGYFSLGGFYFPKSIVMDADLQGVSNDFPQNGFTIGGGGYSMIKGVIIGGRGMGSIGMSIPLSQGKANYTLGGGQFDLGYAFFSKGAIFSFIYLGIGGYSYGIKICNTSDQKLDLGNVVVPSGAEAKINYASFALAPGLNISFLKKFMGLSLDVSYVYLVQRKQGFVQAGLQFLLGGNYGMKK